MGKRRSKVTATRRVARALPAAIVAVLCMLVTIAAPADSSWLGRIGREASEAGGGIAGRAARGAAGHIDHGIAHIRRLPESARGEALAAHTTPDGNWQLANAKGEVFTAATAEEMKRGLATLLPDAAARPDRRLAIYLSDEAAARGPAGLKDLPGGASLSVVVGGEAYKLVRRTSGGNVRLLLEARPHITIEIGEVAALRETVAMLGRRIDPDAIRVLSLDPGGPRALPSRPKRDSASQAALPDSVDAFGVAKALPSLRGQTVVVNGRLDGELLWFRPKSGPEQSILVRDLKAAAAEHDISLVLIDTRPARQPGDRTWAWQRVTVSGLDKGAKGTNVGDLMNAVAAPQGGLVLRAGETAKGRLVIEARPPGAPAAKTSEGRGVGAVLQEVVSEATGNLVINLVQLDLPDRERREELDRRLVAGIPSAVQITYLALLIAGIIGLPLAARWWRRVWPLEERSEYGAAAGYWAARGTRGLVLVLLFMPLVAIVTMPAQIAISTWDSVRAVWRMLTWPLRAAGKG
jgi:hypothetical protein